jgi:hypothetical protein
MSDHDDLASRVDALEQALELTYRPILDLVPPERIRAIEQSAYEAHIRIAALEARIAQLESAAPIATDAHKMASAVFHSRTWKALVGASDLVLRLAGRGGHRSF